ncbi:uncharacterized protein VTP21DRAFT_7753 [Calcarisporiella thermophila]|uniref:uncharacterized protein n=1 Tax=Calcarisporiella thermophila TaxID=911321 RepID=UPI003743CC89
MTDVKGELRGQSSRRAVVAGFLRFMSYHLFSKHLTWDELRKRLQEFQHPFYLLIDEFQTIFEDPHLLKVAKDFFQALSSQSVSYVAVGTFQLTHLREGSGALDTPMDKVLFRPMPLFSVAEMGQLFYLYKWRCNPEGISVDIEEKIVHESRGHPASFMTLLKLHQHFHPTPSSWGRVLQQNFREYMIGTLSKIEHHLARLSEEERAYVRELPAHHMKPWKLDEDHPNPVEELLLNIGVLTPVEVKPSWVQFTNGLLLRNCIDAVWPKLSCCLRRSDVQDPIELLKYGLQYLTRSTLIREQALTQVELIKARYQTGLYTAFQGLLPKPMACIFQVGGEELNEIDLIVMDGDELFAGYQLEVNRLTEIDISQPFSPAKVYDPSYKSPFHQIYFCLEDHGVLSKLERVDRVVVVNIVCTAESTRFTIIAPDGSTTDITP